MGKNLKITLAILFLTSPIFAGEISSDSFGYLNNNQSAAVIDPSQAQDLLNVDVTPGGKSVKKRSGYGLYKTLSGSQGIHGGYHFFDSSGNDVQIWGSSTSLWGIVGDGTPTQLISSATLNATWQCTDSQGFAYCADSSRDALIKTNGATASWYTSPLGTMVAVTPERLLIAGIAAAPNTIYYSAASNFTNFTVGINAQDSSTEQIASPGSRLTHIQYACGRWLWWKDQSFGYVLGTDQTNLVIKTVSNIIGTQDNSDAIDQNGNVYFRGEDGHIYLYDCSQVQKLTVDITPTIQTSGRRSSNSFIQSSQSEFQTGTIVPTGFLSTTVSVGDVVVSSFGVTENSSSQWSNGTTANTTVNPSSVTVALNNSGNLTNSDFESALTGNWTASGLNAGFYITRRASQGTSGSPICNWTPISGSWFVSTAMGMDGWTASFDALDPTTSAVLTSVSMPNVNDCNFQQVTLAPGPYRGRRVKFRFHLRTDDIAAGDEYLTTSDSYIWGGNVTFWYGVKTGQSNIFWAADLVQGGSSTVTTGSFTSRVFNTGFSSSTYQVPTFSYTANTTTPTFVLQTATSSAGAFSTLLTSTGTNAVGNQYARYTVTFPTLGSTDAASSGFTGLSILSRSTGTYYSPVTNRTNLTTWDTLNVTSQNNGGTQTFYVRASTNAFTTLSSTPAWTAQTAGAVISASTGTYFQFRDDFSITAATQTPTLSDFTINWYEGTSSDKAYAAYFDNAIWWSVTYGAGQSTNNYVFKYDLLNPGWTLYNFGAGGFLTQNNNLYFGTVASNGKVYRFGGTTSDDGSAISAYWRSKDYAGDDVFVDNNFRQFDTIARQNTGQTLTVGYILNGSTASATGSFDVSLSSTSTSTIRYKKLLPNSAVGSLFSSKFSDDSATSAWEVLGYRVKYDPLSYQPSR